MFSTAYWRHNMKQLHVCILRERSAKFWNGRCCVVNLEGLFMFRLVKCISYDEFKISTPRWILIASYYRSIFLPGKKTLHSFYWPLPCAAITHDSNEQSAEIPQNKIHPPKAWALTLSAWKNISVRDRSIIPSTKPGSSLSVSASLPLSFSPFDKKLQSPDSPHGKWG